MIRVLIVDDDKDILEVVTLLLTIHGYLAEAISRAEDTNVAIKKFRPNVILLDVNIGGADGRDICSKLKKMSISKNIPVILFSAIQGLEQLHTACGADDYLNKPFEVATLMKMIDRHAKAGENKLYIP